MEINHLVFYIFPDKSLQPLHFFQDEQMIASRGSGYFIFKSVSITVEVNDSKCCSFLSRPSKALGFFILETRKHSALEILLLTDRCYLLIVITVTYYNICHLLTEGNAKILNCLSSILGQWKIVQNKWII